MKIFLKMISMFILLIFIAYPAQAKYCGKVKGVKIVTYGNLSCVKAKSVYHSFISGHIPKGWTCGQSVGGCGIDKKGFIFKH